MQKIRSIANARELAEKFVNMKMEIQLWDKAESSIVLCYICEDEDRKSVKVALVDTWNGTESIQHMSLSEIEEAIWHNRKFINHSGHLDFI